MTKATTQCKLAVAIVTFGMILLIASFVAPPMGEIDLTVLTAIGEVLTFAGSLLGIDYKYRFTTNELSTTNHQPTNQNQYGKETYQRAEPVDYEDRSRSGPVGH